MVREYERLNQFFDSFKEEMRGKKRFKLMDLEEFFIKESTGVMGYESNGGYQGLYEVLKEREEKDELAPIGSSSFNGRRPALKTKWELVKEQKKGWDDTLILRLSRRLDISYYLKRTHLQTQKLAEYLKKIDAFLAEREGREWASREERSLELFQDEKSLLDGKGKRILSRLRLSLSDLKAERYSQMFVYWNRGSEEIREVFILENHSSFIACKRALEEQHSILSYRPDTLIYGGGNQIIKSLKFLEEIAETERVSIRYAGDIDPAGLAIYSGLKEKYSSYHITLHLEYYKRMIEKGREGYYVQKNQDKDSKILESLRGELRERGERDLAERVASLWSRDLRIPQEVITYEVLIREG